jgi:cytochrome c553
MSPDRRKRHMSKRTGLHFAWPALLLALGASVVAHAQDRAMRAREGGLQAKLEYCKTCHGLSGQGYRGYFPMPRLAGQPPQYMENQLRAFIDRRRTNPIMANVAHVLSPSMVSALAAHFRNLDPKPIGGAPRRASALGKRIFEDGLPDANVPACAACHGSDGSGQNEIPRLAGQLYEYTVAQLTGWTKVRGQGSAVDTSAIMAPTAHNLTRAQIEAVAAYVSYLQ